MRIGMVCYPTVGGSGAVAAELAKQLAGRGHEMHVISYRLPFGFGDFQKNICLHEVDLSSYPLFEHPPYELALAVKMAEAVRDHGIELFHVHYAIPHAIAGFLAQQMLGDGAPRMLTTLHGTDITIVGQDHSFFEITRFGIERSDGVTAVSEFLRRMTAEEFQIERPIDVIPNFVDLENYPVAPADRSGIASADQRVLLHVSNFRPVKRPSSACAARWTRCCSWWEKGRSAPRPRRWHDVSECWTECASSGRSGTSGRSRRWPTCFFSLRSSSLSGSRRSRPWPAASPSSAPTPGAFPRSFATRRAGTSSP